MNANELLLMFPAVLDGSCPLDIFADACDECCVMWNGPIGERVRRLGVMRYDRERHYVVLFESSGEWRDAQMPPHFQTRQWANSKSEAESLMRSTAVAWVERALRNP